MSGVEEVRQSGGWTFKFICIVISAYLIVPSSMYSMACLNSPSELIKDFMNKTEEERTGKGMSDNKIETMFGLLVATIGICGTIGSMTASPMADCIGRKSALLISTVTFISGLIIMVLCRIGKSYVMLFVGRAVTGFGAGWGFSLAPPYVMEICLPHQKGAAAMISQMSQSSAILLTQILGYEEILGNDRYWNYLICFPLVFLTIQLFSFPFCPETPRYLLVNRKDEVKASKALRTIRGREDVKEDIEQLRQEMVESSTEAQVSIINLFRTPILRRPVAVALAMGLQQNWSGMNGILFFSTSLFTEVGVSGPASKYATSGSGAVFLLGNIAAVFLLSRFGRKTLFVWGTFGMGICCAVFALTMVFKDEFEALKYVNIVVAMLIMTCYSLGPICVYWILLGELFPHSARGAAFSLASTCAAFGFCTHSYALPVMLNAMESYTFFVFAGIDFVMGVFCIKYMPETKGKSFMDIAKTWSSNSEYEIPFNTEYSVTVDPKEEESNQTLSDKEDMYIEHFNDGFQNDESDENIDQSRDNSDKQRGSEHYKF